MKVFPIFMILISMGVSAEPLVLHPDQLSAITVSPGVTLKELTGRSALGTAKSDLNSVALFHLEPGKASAWSYNKIGEESFFILKGHGKIWTGSHSQEVKEGSFILVPPSVVRSIRAAKNESLEFYAITSPAWSKEDDVLTSAPEGAPK
ncbi:cupin domain-containing protein [Aquirhabdus parva]|uniref:Cupin domain-containing protein n=1 Tax=Aquirhabdus parva TaxID=2283318 RepID=A0A345P4L9_9GAMM|nr:cupin domain-containing protein [Aquirhabdus parva]AXI02228.1 cupin domain-containing protein [Aquirhabdus parva]